jgi:hypothetical protein
VNKPKEDGPDCLRSALIDETLRWARDRSSYYAQAFSHLEFSQPWSLQSLSAIPILTREQVSAAGESMLCSGLHVSHLQNTSGSSGEPLLLYRSIQETQFIREFFSEVNESTEGDLPLVLYLSDSHHGTVTPIPATVFALAGGVTDQIILDQTVRLLQKSFHLPGLGERVIALSGSHSQLLTLTNYCIERDLDSNTFEIRYLHGTGQYLTPRWRHLLEQFWNAQMVDHYSLSEVFGSAVRCRNCNAFHFDPFVIPELVRVDQRTSINKGVGMLLLTTLYPFVQMQPLIRYWTGDVFERMDGPCPIPSFYFKGRLNHCLFDPSDASCLLIAATDLFASVDQYPEVRRPTHFLDIPFTLYREATGRPILSASYAFDGSLLRLQIQLEFSFKPRLYQDRVREILESIRSTLIARSKVLAEAISLSHVVLDLIPADPGSLRPVDKNSNLWQRAEN